MHYVFTDEQAKRLEACRVQFNRLTGQRLNLQKFIEWSINQTLEDAEIAADAVRLALPSSVRVRGAGHGVH